MNSSYRYEICAVLGVLIIQVRLVLEEVRIELLLGKLCIGKNIICEFFNFQLNALGFKQWGNRFEDFRMRYRRSTNHQGYRVRSRLCSRFCSSRIRGVIGLVVSASGKHQYQGQAEECKQYFFICKSPLIHMFY